MKNKFKAIMLWGKFSNFVSSLLVAVLVYELTLSLIVAFSAFIAMIATLINLKLYINDQLNLLWHMEKGLVNTTYAKLYVDIRKAQKK